MIRNKCDLIKTRQYKRYANNDNNFIKIPKNFCAKWELDPTSAMIYKVIADADALEYKCYTGSKNDLATITYTSLKTVFRVLKTLCERGFIAKINIKINDRVITAYKNLGIDCNLPIHKGNPFTTYEKLLINNAFKDKFITKWAKENNIDLV